MERCIDDELPFEIPDSWVWVRLGTVLEIARGGSPRPIQQYLTTEPDGINWIKIGDTDKGGKYIYKTKEKIRPEGVTKSRMVHSGDFLLTNSMSFGRPYILKTDGCIHDGWLVLSNRFDCNGVQREHNKKLNNGLPILHKVPPKRDYGRYFCIMAEKGGTSHGGLTEKLSPFFHAKKQEVNAYGR